jgi:lipase
MRDIAIPIGVGEINVWHREPSSGSPTIVLVHGLTGTSRWWIPVISRVGQDLGLLALDLRGRGQSWESPGPYDLKTIADDVARCLDHFRVERAVVAGYSMGAWVATVFAQHHPDRAERLVLVDGGLPPDFDMGLTTQEILDQIVGPAVARLSMDFDSLEGYLDFWKEHPALVGRWDPLLEDVFAHEVRRVGPTWRVRANLEAITRGGSDFALDEPTVTSGRETTTTTTLLVVDHGIIDQPGGFIPLGTAREAASANPNITVRLLEGLNHYTLMLGEGAPAVAEAIDG